MSYKDSIFRLSIWYKDPIKKEGLIIHRTGTWDFGDAQASLALRVAQDRYIASNCQTESGKLTAEWPFTDNYLMSSQCKEDL